MKNKSIVLLRKLDPTQYTFKVLDEIFGLKSGNAQMIYRRNKDKYDLPDWIEDKRKDLSVDKILKEDLTSYNILQLKLLGKSNEWIGKQVGLSRETIRKRLKKLSTGKGVAM